MGVLFRADCELTILVKDEADPAAASKSSDATSDSTGAADSKPQTDSSTAPADSAAGSGAASWRWQERGTGVIHINRHRQKGSCRLVMRMRGVLKLLLNTPIFPTTKYEKIGQKLIRFVGVDAKSGDDASAPVSLSAYRLNLHSGDQQAKFSEVLRTELGITVQ